MSKKNQIKLALAPALSLVLISLIWIFGLKPLTLTYIDKKIPELLNQQPHIKLKYEKIDFSLTQLQLSLKNLELETTTGFLKINIPFAKAQLDPFNIFIGQLSFSYFKIDQAQVSLHENLWANNNKETDLTLDLAPLFKILPDVPLSELILNKPVVKILFSPREKNYPDQINIQPELIFIQNNKQNINLKITTAETQFFINKKNLNFSWDLSTLVSQNSLMLKTFLIKDEFSKIKLKGSINNLINLTKNPQFTLQVESDLNLESVKNNYAVVHSLDNFASTSLTQPLSPSSQKNKKVRKKSEPVIQSRLPQVQGLVHLNGQLSSSALNINEGLLQLTTEKVVFDFFKIGDANIRLNIKNNQLIFDQVELNHPAGKVKLNKLEIAQEKPFKFSTKISITQFELKKMFESIDVKNAPVNFNSSALGECQGQFTNFEVSCISKIIIEDVLVKPSLESPQTIVALDKALINAQLKFNLKEFTYKALVQLASSDFNSSGVVDYEKGFQLQFNSNKVVLTDFKNIADLKLKGLLAGELKTSGHSNAGVIEAQLKASDLSIDQFFLGQLQTQMNYEQAQLNFQKLTGQIKDSLYQGDLALDFNSSTLQGQILAKKIFGQDILLALKERFQLNFNLTGQGQAQMSFSGPFDFFKMNLNLSAQLNKGQIAGESYSALFANIKSDGQIMKFEKVQLHKPTSQVNLEGFINTQQTPTLHLELNSKNLKLDDVDHITTVYPNISGQLLLNGQIAGPLEQAEVKTQINAKEITIEGQPYATSQGELVINKNELKFNGQVFGRQAQVAFQIPFTPEGLYIIKGQLRDFNPFLILPLIKLPLPPNDSFASLTTEFDLKGSQFNYKQINGQIKLEQLLFVKNTQVLKLTKPTELILDNGLKSLTPFELKNAEQSLKFQLNKNLLQAQGELSLKPFMFLTPFLENLSGQLKINLGLQTQAPKLTVLGVGELKNGFLQLKGFPYPIKDLKSQIDFSQSKILLSNIQAQLNQSQINGKGSLNFISPQQIEVNITTEPARVDLEFPPQFQTAGLVQTQIFGSWIPYTLKIDYMIDSGLITKEFTEAEENTNFVLSASRFLPTQQLENQNPSLKLDIKAHFPKGILIKNQIIEGTVAGDVNVIGSPEKPILKGKVNLLTGSKLIFKDKPFEVQTGLITFNQNTTNPSPEIKPEIYLTANSRVSDYDINLLVQGSGKNLSIKPTSQPPLSENDIFSLLALGFTSTNQEQNFSSKLQQQQTGLEVIAALSNQSKINKQIQQKLGLNVQIAPSIDSTKNIAVPKVLVSRKLTKKINASYARPLTGDQLTNEVKLQWLFHPDFSVNLNYENNESQQNNNSILNNQKQDGNYGVDLEYKKEFN